MDIRRCNRVLPALLVWIVIGAAMFLCDGRLDLANMALLLVTASALAALWLPAWTSMATSAAAVLAFNWFFVPPRFTLDVDLQQNSLLLGVIMLVNWIIAGLVIRQRSLTETARAAADREYRMRQWGDALRDAGDPVAHAEALRAKLQEATGCEVAVAVFTAWDRNDESNTIFEVGLQDDEQRAGMSLCVREGKAMGPGCGRYDDLPANYLPLRGRGITLGAALIVNLGDRAQGIELIPHLQALCDQMGSALQRYLMTEHERMAREQAQLQATRNALLAAISHDYRTPLATIMGAASALKEKDKRMDTGQRQRLSGAILEESERLLRLTENTLQLARLDTPAVTLASDWESADEIVGAALKRVRQRADGERVRASVAPNIPLLWCDPILISQMLDNLLDNGLKYSEIDLPVELNVRQEIAEVIFAVVDSGPGVAPAFRQKVFEIFQRGELHNGDLWNDSLRGSGVGLAVCQAIAHVHGGRLHLIPRSEGGSVFEFRLPLRDNADFSVPSAVSKGPEQL